MGDRAFQAALLTTCGLFGLASQAHGQAYFVEWPEHRQHLLEGAYTGTVRDTAREGEFCEFQAADLDVHPDRRYTIRLRCVEDETTGWMLQGSWWVDEIAGSCLILMREPPSPSSDERMYGFRILGAAEALRQDGGSCQSASERDHGMVLERSAAGTGTPP